MTSVPLAIGQLAQATGETIKTLRYWSDLGLLPHQRRPSGYRAYPHAAVEQARFIRSAQAAGFGLHEIANILQSRDQGEKPCAHVHAELKSHLVTVRDHLARLQVLEQQLVERLAWAEANPDPTCESPGCVYLQTHS